MSAFLDKNVPARKIEEAKAEKEQEPTEIAPPKQATTQSQQQGVSRGMLGDVEANANNMGVIKKKKATAQDVLGGNGSGGKTTMGD